MSKYYELKRLAEAANAIVGDVDFHFTIARAGGCDQAEVDAVAAFLGKANPHAILELIAEVEALREKASELSVEAVRYRYLATTTWSDDVTDALCLQDKEQVDRAVDAAVLEAML